MMQRASVPCPKGAQDIPPGPSVEYGGGKGVDMQTTTIATFINHVEAHPRQPVDELAAFWGVTPRTVRTYVSVANTELAGCARVVAADGGYRVQVDDEARYAAWKARSSASLWGGVPDTPQGRVAFLINDLLVRADWVTLDTLADALYCSRRTVASDLKNVEAYLGMFGLTLERRPHRGVRVEGSEMARRICLANIALDRMASAGGIDELPAGEDDAGVPHRNFQLDVIAGCVDRAVEREGFSVNSVAYQNLLVHIAIAIARIRAGSYMPAQMPELDAMERSSSWTVAEQIAGEISAALDLELPRNEIAYLAIHLAGKRIVLPGEGAAAPDEAADGEESDEITRAEAGSAISEEAWDIALRMVQAVDQALGLDLARDLELRMNLARHAGPLAVRLQYRMRLENPLLKDIRARYPFAYACGLEAARVLVAAYGNEVSEDEVGYLALAFALALERRRAHAARPRNILVVCASGRGSSQLLAMRCREEFGDQLGSVRACDVSRIHAVDYADIDYVFTTVPLPADIPVPVLQVGYFLDRSDVAGVHDLLHAREPNDVAAFFSADLFLAHLEADTPDEVIQLMADHIAGVEQIDEEFCALVCEREAIASTAYGNAVAMPHPLRAASARTFVCAACAERPITWGTQQVEVIFLVSVCADPDEDLHGLYDVLLTLAADEHARARLVAEPRFEVLLELIDAARGDGAA